MSYRNAQALARGMRRLAAVLYHRLAQGDGNLFFSPLSIATALLLVHAGARGETRREIEQVLGINLPDDQLHAAFSRLDADLAERNRRHEQIEPIELAGLPITLAKSTMRPGDYYCRLRSAAGLWLQDGYPCEESFLAIARQVFGADRQTVDFTGDPDSSADIINTWVREQTEGLIDRIVDSSSFNPLTRLVLASTTYFKASWLFRFEKQQTKLAPFHRPDGPPVDLDMMEQIAALPYARHDECQVVDLHYETSQLRFVVVLPDTGQLDTLDSSLDRNRLDELLFGRGNTATTRIRLRLPKFRLEADVNLTFELANLGIRRLFGDQSDLSGLSAEPGLHIDKVLHKSVVSVDEDGTEAAAITYMGVAGGIGPSGEPIDVTCDRPFLFFIVDEPTRTILFAGRFVDPDGAGSA